MEIGGSIETLRGESLKTAAEVALSGLSKFRAGEKLLQTYAFGLEGRIEDPRLHTEIAGLIFENPVLVGAGWDKKGRAIRGLYDLGFAGVDVGTVLLFGQPGNPKPRLWTINQDHSVGLNRLGFNSPGMETVGEYLDKVGPQPFPVGVNVGLNKLMPHDHAPWAHAAVVDYLYDKAAYFVLGVSSPNTKDLRGLQEKEKLRGIIQAVIGAMVARGALKPLFIKISEMEPKQLDDVIEVALEEGVTGLQAINTTVRADIKAKYGARWENEMGGLSGADEDYQLMAKQTVKYIYEAAGDKLVVIGVGGISDGNTALDLIEAGASAVQVVTAIRPSKGKVAAITNKEILNYMSKTGVTHLDELIGVATIRGPKA